MMTTLEPDEKDNHETLWWLCPFCGKTSLNRMASTNAGAQGALRSHIYASAGNGHGPEFAFPAEFDPTTLTDHLTSEAPTQ